MVEPLSKEQYRVRPRVQDSGNVLEARKKDRVTRNNRAARDLGRSQKIPTIT